MLDNATAQTLRVQLCRVASTDAYNTWACPKPSVRGRQERTIALQHPTLFLQVRLQLQRTHTFLHCGVELMCSTFHQFLVHGRHSLADRKVSYHCYFCSSDSSQRKCPFQLIKADLNPRIKRFIPQQSNTVDTHGTFNKNQRLTVHWDIRFFTDVVLRPKSRYREEPSRMTSCPELSRSFLQP